MIQKCSYIPKGWGFERWVVNNDLYCGKELFIARGRKFSVHYHEKKDETFYVTEGKAYLSYAMLPPDEHWDDIQMRSWWNNNVKFEEMNVGDVFHVPPRMVHTLQAVTDFTVMEFSTHHDDDDSYRIIRWD